MADEPPPTLAKSVSDEDLQKAFSGPAFVSNRMFASTTGAGLRIAFMEEHGTKVPPIFRTAVLLPFINAIALRDLLNRQLKDIEPQLKAAEAEARAAAAEAEKKNG